MRQQNTANNPESGTSGAIMTPNGFAKNGTSKGELNGNRVQNGSSSLGNSTAASSFAMLPPPVPTPDYFGHDRKEVTRILIQSLWDLGYTKAAAQLEEDSEYTLEAPEVSHFRRAILNGEWTKAEKLLYSLELNKDADINALLFYTRQQKFLELLENRDTTRALAVLRQELTPLNRREERLRALASLMMCMSPEEVRKQANWDGAAGNSRRQLLSELSESITPSTMIPEHRLATLLHQVKEAQISKCLYHNTANPPSLYSDHLCQRNQFPLSTVKVLADHTDEVWFLAFSHDGERLATASQDRSVIIWDVETWEVIHHLKDHNSPVTYVQWSPDDSKIISTCSEKKVTIWDTQNGQNLLTIDAHLVMVTSCAWAPDGQTFVTGSDDKDLSVWNLQGSSIHKWSGSRIFDLAITPDGSRVVAICSDKMVHVFNFHTHELEYRCSMSSDMTSISVSRDSKYMLINMASLQEVHLYEIETTRLVQRFVGQKQGEFVIRSCFGGADENLVLSGSEDGCVYVWQRVNGNLVEKLPGHQGPVNCVAWNSKSAHQFASAGDDKVIRIWSNQGNDKTESMEGIL